MPMSCIPLLLSPGSWCFLFSHRDNNKIQLAAFYLANSVRAAAIMSRRQDLFASAAWCWKGLWGHDNISRVVGRERNRERARSIFLRRHLSRAFLGKGLVVCVPQYETRARQIPMCIDCHAGGKSTRRGCVLIVRVVCASQGEAKVCWPTNGRVGGRTTPTPTHKDIISLG
jgi:hypothetical protein